MTEEVGFFNLRVYKYILVHVYTCKCVYIYIYTREYLRKVFQIYKGPVRRAGIVSTILFRVSRIILS